MKQQRIKYSFKRTSLWPGIIALFLGMLTPLKTVAQSPSTAHNYVMENVVRVSGKTTPAQLVGLPVQQVNRTLSYYDGLGRLIQQTAWQASPAGHDLITPKIYDALGRETLCFEPYTVSANGGAYRNDALLITSGQQAYYLSPPSGIAPTSYPYSRSVSEKSPLQRVLDQGATGNAWQPYRASISESGHSVRSVYGANANSEVRQWILHSNGNGATSSYYEPNRLRKTITKDENWKSTDGLKGTLETYENLEGLTVLKRHRPSSTEYFDTYYVYDAMGKLRYVLPPAVTGLGSAALTTFTEQSTAFQQYIYGYHYDHRNRLVEKKIPGKGWEYTVYNLLDQVIFTQDSVQRQSYQWTFYKYDAMGREIIRGSYQDSSPRSLLQVNVVNLGLPLWEQTDPLSSTGYTNNAYPNVSITAFWQMHHYDDYLFFDMGSTFPPHSVVSKKTKGLLTGKRTYRTDQLSADWTIYYYDDHGRVKERVGINHRNGLERTIDTYNFAGERTSSLRQHTPLSSSTTTIQDSVQYDHIGRNLATLNKINSQDRIWLAKLSYNEIGQLKQQELHSENGSTFLQQSRYAYNQRGWIKRSTSPQFSFQLAYDTLAHPQYNGNISTQLWGSGNSFPNRFDYLYDGFNRLSSAVSTGISMSELLTYDEMGNIRTMNRDGAGTATYSYFGNRLTAISGGGLSTSSYSYDANGNATSDGRNGAIITYNFLNLPISVSKGLLLYSYVYDTEGRKLQKEDHSTAVITDYFEGIQTINGTIDFIQHEYGRAKNNGGTYVYEYDLKDHLGNVRYRFDKNGGILRKLQADDYYAFGLRKVVTAGNNKYLYNSKELQDELGQYDYGARFYDPVIARWNVVDPLAEVYEDLSPYNYAFNNPVRHTDPDGMQVQDPVINEKDPIKLKEVVITPKPSFANTAGTIFLATSARTSAIWRLTAANPEPYSKIALAVAATLFTGYVIYNEIDKYNKTHSVSAEKTVDDLKKDGKSEAQTGKGTEVINKEGGMKQADKDFDDIILPGTARPNPSIPGGRIGKTPDGKTVNVRNKSSDGRPTLEIFNPGTKKIETKFRYK